jgi:hypothetical protein
MASRHSSFRWFALLSTTVPLISAATLHAGPGKQYAAPCAAIAEAHDGDRIEIEGGLYRGDVCAFSQNNLTIAGVNGRPHLDAAGKIALEKGIWVASGNDLTVDNVEFSGAVSVDHNGAGIRAAGVNWTVRNCYFHDNEDGILESNIAGSKVLIEHSEFARNGYGDGQAHNFYIGHCAQLIFRFNYTHDSIEGHLVKTRAGVNYILYNRITGETGTGSYEINIPNGGTSYVIGNMIEQGPDSHNAAILDYLSEGPSPNNPETGLYVINNTFVNHRDSGVFIQTKSATPTVIKNNIFRGPGTLTNQAGAVLSNNFTGDPTFVDEARYDYRLKAGSPAIDAGATPGTAVDPAGIINHSLTPAFQYVHPAKGAPRRVVGAAIDIGAYEYAGAGRSSRR